MNSPIMLRSQIRREVAPGVDVTPQSSICDRTVPLCGCCLSAEAFRFPGPEAGAGASAVINSESSVANLGRQLVPIEVEPAWRFPGQAFTDDTASANASVDDVKIAISRAMRHPTASSA